MDRRNFLRITSVGTLGLFLRIKLPEAVAAPKREVVVSRPLTNITAEYMKKNSWRIPFGPMPPLNPEVGDRWWVLGKHGHYEIATFNGRTWKR